MATIYYFIDESIREEENYWHSNIGGTLISVEDVVDIEIALETRIYECIQAAGLPDTREEFKYESFFRDTPDEFKFNVCSELVDVFAQSDAAFLVSHAMIEKRKLQQFGAPSEHPSMLIQRLAQTNINGYLSGLLNSSIVQIVVDLGISEAFLPTYKIYAGGARSAPVLKAAGYKDDLFTINFRHLPTPLFLDSKDSRILQFSDLLIGLLLCQETKQLTPFKESLLKIMTPIKNKIRVNSVEWNKDGI